MRSCRQCLRKRYCLLPVLLMLLMIAVLLSRPRFNIDPIYQRHISTHSATSGLKDKIADPLTRLTTQATAAQKQQLPWLRFWLQTLGANATERVLYYSRVPKCGSSSMHGILEKLAKTHRFSIVENRALGQSRRPLPIWGITRMEMEGYPLEHFKKMIYSDQLYLQQEVSRKRANHVISNHGFYFNYSADNGILKPVMFSIVRDPVSRVRSLYSYKYQSHQLNAEFWGTDLDNCVLENKSYCSNILENALYDDKHKSKTYFWWQTSLFYLCGYSDRCFGDLGHAVNETIKHLRRDLIFTGLTEDMTGTVRALQWLLPEYMYGASAHLQKNKVNQGSRKDKSRLSLNSTAHISQMLHIRTEQVLYNEAARLFKDRLGLLDLLRKQHVSSRLELFRIVKSFSTGASGG